MRSVRASMPFLIPGQANLYMRNTTTAKEIEPQMSSFVAGRIDAGRLLAVVDRAALLEDLDALLGLVGELLGSPSSSWAPADPATAEQREDGDRGPREHQT